MKKPQTSKEKYSRRNATTTYLFMVFDPFFRLSDAPSHSCSRNVTAAVRMSSRSLFVTHLTSPLNLQLIPSFRNLKGLVKPSLPLVWSDGLRRPQNVWCIFTPKQSSIGMSSSLLVYISLSFPLSFVDYFEWVFPNVDVFRRDVKPDNILLRADTSGDGLYSYGVRLTDFGIAKFMVRRLSRSFFPLLSLGFFLSHHFHRHFFRIKRRQCLSSALPNTSPLSKPP
jgi:hypothetical protein